MGGGKIKIKDHLSPAEAETRTELGNKKQNAHMTKSKHDNIQTR